MRFLSSIFLGSILVGVGQTGELADTVCFGNDLQPVRDFIKLTRDTSIDGLLFTEQFTEFTNENFISIVYSLLEKATAGTYWCHDLSDFVEDQGENIEGLMGLLFGDEEDHCEHDDCEHHDEHDDDHDDEDHDDDDHDERKRRDEDDNGEDDEGPSPDQIMEKIRELGGDFRKVINKIMDDIDNPEAVRKFKNFITQISNYITRKEYEGGRTHFQMYFEYFTGGAEIPQEYIDFITVLVEQFNMDRPSSRSGEIRDGCNEMINMVTDEYRMKYKPKIQKFHQIYKKFFGAEIKYDSPGFFVNSIYSIARHLFTNNYACADLLNSIQRLGEETEAEFERQFGNEIDKDLEDVFERKDTYKAKQMEDKLMNIMQEKMRTFGMAFNKFLKADDNADDEEQNAMRGWFILTGKAKRFLQMMPELWDWAKTDMRADFNEMGFDMNDIPFDISSMASRQEAMMNDMTVTSTCGETAAKQCGALSNYEQEYTMVEDEDGGFFGGCFMFCSASGIVPAMALLLGLLFIHVA